MSERDFLHTYGKGLPSDFVITTELIERLSPLEMREAYGLPNNEFVVWWALRNLRWKEQAARATEAQAVAAEVPPRMAAVAAAPVQPHATPPEPKIAATRVRLKKFTAPAALPPAPEAAAVTVAKVPPPEAPAKRARGRPAKAVTAPLPEAPPRKRGRPRKAKA